MRRRRTVHVASRPACVTLALLTLLLLSPGAAADEPVRPYPIVMVRGEIPPQRGLARIRVYGSLDMDRSIPVRFPVSTIARPRLKFEGGESEYLVDERWKLNRGILVGPSARAIEVTLHDLERNRDLLAAVLTRVSEDGASPPPDERVADVRPGSAHLRVLVASGREEHGPTVACVPIPLPWPTREHVVELPLDAVGRDRLRALDASTPLGVELSYGYRGPYLADQFDVARSRIGEDTCGCPYVLAPGPDPASGKSLLRRAFLRSSTGRWLEGGLDPGWANDPFVVPALDAVLGAVTSTDVPEGHIFSWLLDERLQVRASCAGITWLMEQSSGKREKALRELLDRCAERGHAGNPDHTFQLMDWMNTRDTRVVASAFAPHWMALGESERSAFVKEALAKLKSAQRFCKGEPGDLAGVKMRDFEERMAGVKPEGTADAWYVQRDVTVLR